MNNDNYENGPSGMPRVKRMPDAVLECIIDGSTFRFHANRYEGEERDRLYNLMHVTAEEVLARLSWPERATPAAASAGAAGTIDTPERDLNYLLFDMDAKHWADEYQKLNPSANHGMMHTWFACAIMTGFDEANRRHERAATAPVSAAPVDLIVRDIAELDYSSDTVPDLLEVSEADLRAIIERHSAAPVSADPNPWHAAILAECMRIETGYLPGDPAKTISNVIDWHAQHASEVSDTIKVQADNYLKMTCGSQSAGAPVSAAHDYSQLPRYTNRNGTMQADQQYGPWVTLLDVMGCPPAHPDDQAVDRFAAAMKEKMAASRAKGRGGWDDPDQCGVQDLARMLVEHVEKGDALDIGNFAMMLWNRKAMGFDIIAAALAHGRAPVSAAPQGRFKIGDTVRKTKGSQWSGEIVGTYSTSLTPEGYAVESSTERGSVQIYPVGALEFVAAKQAGKEST